MMFTHKNLMTVCCAAVLAFGLAACSSSSDDDKVVTKKTTPVVPGETVDPAPTDDEIAAATKAAGTKADAIGVEAEQGEADNPDAGLGGSTTADIVANAAGFYALSIARDRDGTTVTITVVEAEDDDPKFMPGPDLDGGRTMLVRVNSDDEDGKVEEVVIVKTDIDAPTATAFAKVDGQMLNVRQDRAEATDDDPDDALTILAVEVTEGADDVILPKIMAARFTSGTAAELMFDSDDGDTDDMDEAFETAGTYNGAMGTYRCNGDTDCTVTLDAKGAIIGISGEWIFTPDPGATSDVADAEYLQYGFWLMRTTKDGATTYNEVETFAEATGILETDVSNIQEIQGTAAYEGGSVGVYVKNVLDNQGGIVSATSGHFSADVALTANFGGGSLPINNQYTIEGTVTDFVLQHDEENDWAVGLGLADFSGRDADAGNEPGESGPGSSWTNVFNGVATGDSTAAPGSWNGMFHGVAGDVGTAPEVVNTTPAAVVGEFDANFTDGTAAGGFGANKK